MRVILLWLHATFIQVKNDTEIRLATDKYGGARFCSHGVQLDLHSTQQECGTNWSQHVQCVHETDLQFCTLSVL